MDFRQPDQPLPVIAAPAARAMILAVCCPICHSLRVHRRSSQRHKAYWVCADCGHGWTEPPDIGRGQRAVPAL